MAKELSFSLAGAEYAAAPVKLERKKIYGWSDLVATDNSGEVYGTGLKEITVSSENLLEGVELPEGVKVIIAS